MQLPYTIKEDNSEPIEGSGTRLILHIKDDGEEYLDDFKIKELCQKYSEFVSFPIEVWSEKTKYEQIPDPDAEVKEGETPPTKTVSKTTYEWDTMNKMKPIWMRSPKEVTETEYTEFYKSTFKAWDEPLAHAHFSLEGQKYKKFWGSFGKYLKVGIVEDEDNKDVLAKLVRFQSTHENGVEPVSLQSYVGRMKEGQSSVYYICADSSGVFECTTVDASRAAAALVLRPCTLVLYTTSAALMSPSLEKARSLGYEVLFMTEPLDELCAQAIEKFDGKHFCLIAKGTECSVNHIPLHSLKYKLAVH
eukprot:11703-Heterococcus_DN1.PRE.3